MYVAFPPCRATLTTPQNMLTCAVGDAMYSIQALQDMINTNSFAQGLNRATVESALRSCCDDTDSTAPTPNTQRLDAPAGPAPNGEERHEVDASSNRQGANTPALLNGSGDRHASISVLPNINAAQSTPQNNGATVSNPQGNARVSGDESTPSGSTPSLLDGSGDRRPLISVGPNVSADQATPQNHNDAAVSNSQGNARVSSDESTPRPAQNNVNTPSLPNGSNDHHASISVLPNLNVVQSTPQNHNDATVQDNARVSGNESTPSGSNSGLRQGPAGECVCPT
ncbi:hypothetical protein B0H12DRAFT_1096827 [Mycena haematopus]|nr:hypothetical protein B0H12DRAFT_1096827 [Mycena haematopus]